jgi:ribosomal-protein-alanine N-acetyltransferase
MAPDDGHPSDPFDATPAVRDATAEDVATLLGIQAAALPDPSPSFLRTAVRAGLVLVAEPLVGDPLATPDPVGYLSHTVDEDAVYIAELAVAPSHRRRGHGSRLLDALAERYPGRAELRLTTRESNTAAREFYASVGFRETKTLPGHYEPTMKPGDGDEKGSDDEDGVLLCRAI